MVNSIGSRIKEIRNDTGLTLEAFGEKIGCARNTISNYESGNRNPSNQTILSICKTFSVNKEWLTEGTGEMYNSRVDEAAYYISSLLEQEDDPVHQLIFDIMKTYSQLDEKEKLVLQKFAKEFKKNIKDGD